MFRNLNPGAIGIHADLERSLKIAHDAGFEGVDLPLGEAERLSSERSVNFITSLYERFGMKVGGCGLPFNWLNDSDYERGLNELPKWARLASDVGCVRFITWVPSFSDERPYDENFKWHVERFKPIVGILSEHGCRLGLEFLGTRTLRIGHKYEFIHTIGQMIELCNAIGTGNVGLLLDSWHWWTSGGTLEDIRKLSQEQVVYVHVNDAPAGIPVDEQLDNVRCLPGETGVIDLVGFLRALKDIGYDGPVTPEPFSKSLSELPDEEAALVTARALNRIWEMI
ncbi:MAG: sugar phosphate isomerase/epimerase family protein [Armatimonadota bacterium]|nr:sugar phosphate isomerase/epimerase [Armatimonadota bacterium]MDW8024973.1 sugar phosphate isomerase/epimerase family protein [Armatimonadota bacterium]